MSALEAIILGIIQGLTEFLPVSSSGHLEIGNKLLAIEVKDNLLFTIVVHAATALSTIVVFRNDIAEIFKGIFEFKWNESTQYTAKIVVSMVPIFIVGVFFEEEIEQLFTGNLILVGSMLLVTAALLSFTYFFRKQNGTPVNYLQAAIIGVAQSIAILPGISRSGSTIATALILGVDREKAARFSFLMVLVPILGATALKVLDLMELQQSGASANISGFALTIGFLAAFISGLLACAWMVRIVKKGKLIYFAIYCGIIGLIAISSQLF